MLGSELVQDVGGVEAGVVTQLAGNDLQGFGVSTNQQLLLAWNGPGVVPQVFGKLHLDRATASNDRIVLKEQGKLTFQKAEQENLLPACVAARAMQAPMEATIIPGSFKHKPRTSSHAQETGWSGDAVPGEGWQNHRLL